MSVVLRIPTAVFRALSSSIRVTIRPVAACAQELPSAGAADTQPASAVRAPPAAGALLLGHPGQLAQR